MAIKNHIYNIPKNQESSVVFYMESASKVNLSKITGVDSKSTLLIYDKNLEQLSAFKLLKKQSLYTYPLEAGESLKDLSKFSMHLNALNKKYGNFVNRHTHIISVGGGSVGDFVGFLASVWKRGLGLTHIPSTWLAAVDSSHGGKTALNIEQGKNQVGSFYSARSIVIIKDLLSSSSLEAAYGEILKIAFLRKTLLPQLQKPSLWVVNFIWNLLPSLVKEKYFYILKDPLETTGQRIYLNLGHTLAHILEPSFAIPHGVAVTLGLKFSLQWSLHKKLISKKEFDKYNIFVEPLAGGWRRDIKLLSQKAVLKLLLQDKKIKNLKNIQFIFFSGKGHVVKTVSIISFMKELGRQNYLK